MPSVPQTVKAFDGLLWNPFCNHGQVEEDEEDTKAAELRRYEEEREARIRYRNKVSGAVVIVIMAAALALLGYDSATAALRAHHSGRPWAYPLTLAVVCALALLAGAVRILRRPR
jgi:hypothetical protein